MLDDFASYDELVHSIYDAALEPTRWSDVVSRVAGVCNASRAMLFTVAHTAEQGGFFFTHNLPQQALDRWASLDVEARADPFFQTLSARNRIVEGDVHVGEELVPRADLVVTSFYKQWWVPIGIDHLCVGIVFDGTDAHKLPVVLSLYRSLDEGPFRPREVDIVRRLLAHMSRALGTMFHLRDRQLQVAATRAALDQLSAGVVLVDGSKGVQFANRSARVLFAEAGMVLMQQKGGFGVPQLSLHSRLRAPERAFQTAIESALRPLEMDAEEHFSKALVLLSAEGRPQCVVHVAPLSPTSASFATGASAARAIVFLYEVGRACEVRSELLCELFDMTPAEARAGLQVLQGGGAKEMARRLGVSINTFKTQLHQAFVKSQTHRQTDLLKLLLSLASH